MAIPYDRICFHSIADNMDCVLKIKQKRLIMQVMWNLRAIRSKHEIQTGAIFFDLLKINWK